MLPERSGSELALSQYFACGLMAVENSTVESMLLANYITVISGRLIESSKFIATLLKDVCLEYLLADLFGSLISNDVFFNFILF